MSPKFIPSPHYSSREGRSIQAIVIHRMVGTFQGTISWFQNPQSEVSAHYLVSQDGEIVQMVRDHESAWHAGYKSGTPPEIFKNVNPNWVSIGIECEDRTSEDTNFWTQKQLDSLIDLCKILIKQYSIPIDRQHIVGHNEVDPVGKPYDPGRFFPWDEFMKYLLEEVKEGAEKPPEEPKPDLSKRVAELEEELAGERRKHAEEIYTLREQHDHLTRERNEARGQLEELRQTLGQKELKLLAFEEGLKDMRLQATQALLEKEELAKVVKELSEGEKSLRGLLERLQREREELVKEKEVSKLNLPKFDTSKSYIRFIQIFLWSGLSGVLPVVVSITQDDPRLLALWPVINAVAKVAKDYVEKNKTAST